MITYPGRSFEGHVIAAMRDDRLNLVSHHPTDQEAQAVLRRLIDTRPLQVVPARVTLAPNGNVRLWEIRS